MPENRWEQEQASNLDLQLSLEQLWSIILRRRIVAVIGFVLAVLVGGVSIMRSPAIYKSTSTVRIEMQSAPILGHTVQGFDTNGGGYGYWAQQGFFETQYKIISSRAVAERVVVNLNLSPSLLIAELESFSAEISSSESENYIDKLPEPLRNRLGLLVIRDSPSKEKLIESLNAADAPAIIRSRVIVQPIDETRLVFVSVEGRSPENTTKLTNAVANAYIEVNLEQKRSSAQEAVTWLSQQVGDLKIQLSQSEIELQNFKSANDIVSVSLRDRQSILSQRLIDLNKELSQVQTEAILADSRLTTIRQSAEKTGVASGAASFQSNLYLEQLKQSLSSLKQQEGDQATRYTENHPKLIATRERVRQVKSQLSEELDKELGNLKQEHLTKLESARQLQIAINKVKRETLNANEKSYDYTRLEREAANNLNLYNLVLNRQKEAELAQMLRANNVQMLEAAILPNSPIRPRKKVALAGTLIIAFILSIGLAILFDMIDNTVKSQQHIEQDVGTSFLGILPLISNKQKEAGDTAKQAEVAEGDSPLMVRDQFILSNPRSSVAECSRTIRTNLFFMSPDNPAQTLVVTSSSPQEGKSTVTINLGITIAQSGRRTLIIDADMRRPRLHRSFGLSNDKGLSNIILGESELEETVHHLGVEGLDLLTCGPIPPNPAELLHTESFKNLVTKVRSEYDQIVFDSPPVNPVSDALVLGSMLDGVIFVTDAGNTRIPAARDATMRLKGVGSRILGTVLNNVDLEQRSGAGYYGYQYYYYRGSYYYGETTDQAASS